MEVYGPGEDSYLLQKHIDMCADSGLFLDMGTGTGIQAISAAKRFKKVISADINPEALKIAKMSAEIEGLKNIEFRQSDLFENISETDFDVIAFNPPYLPESDDGSANDVALVSGKRGVDTTLKFLEQAQSHLKKEGKIFLVSSSLASQHLLKGKMDEMLFRYEVIDKEHIFFEDILLYELTFSYAGKMAFSLGVENPMLFASGKRGIIIKGNLGKKPVCIKMKKPGSQAMGTIENESRFLEILNKEGIGPKMISYNTMYLMYGFVEGIFIEEFIDKSGKQDILAVILDMISQLSRMDEMGINKFEMHHPHKHILISDNLSPVLLDFERCRYTENPKNLSQFCDYLTGDDMMSKLAYKGISISRDEMIRLSIAYKTDYDPGRIRKYIEGL